VWLLTIGAIPDFPTLLDFHAALAGNERVIHSSGKSRAPGDESRDRGSPGIADATVAQPHVTFELAAELGDVGCLTGLKSLHRPSCVICL